MSKWTSTDRYIDENGKHCADCDTPEQAARLVALLNEGEADTRRLDKLEAMCPVNLGRVLDCRTNKENTVTTWILEQHTERFGRKVRELYT